MHSPARSYRDYYLSRSMERYIRPAEGDQKGWRELIVNEEIYVLIDRLSHVMWAPHSACTVVGSPLFSIR
jgi:hypothetical protein